jgi:NTE family protein
VASVSTGHTHRDALLAQYLTSLFGEVGQDTASFLRQHVRWVEVAAGEVLMEQGAPGDSAYLSVSGRLRVYIAGDDGVPRMVRELGRGEVIGEMSLYTGEPRSATVVAVRDSVLARLDKPRFDELLALSPQVSLVFTRQIIGRLQTQHLRRPMPAPVTVAMLPVTEGLALAAFAQRLGAELARFGRVCVVDAAAIEQELGEVGAAVRDDAELDRRIAMALDGIEAKHDFVLLLADAGADALDAPLHPPRRRTAAARRCHQPPALHPIEHLQFLGGRRAARRPRSWCCCTRPTSPARAAPRQWLARRPVPGTCTCAPNSTRHGAPGAAAQPQRRRPRAGRRRRARLRPPGHLRRCAERGIEIDCVGGTSIGAVMAALIAADRPAGRQGDRVARRAFRGNPTGDYNLLPLMSLIRGRRAARRGRARAGELLVGARSTSRTCGRASTASPATTRRASEQVLREGDAGQRCAPAWPSRARCRRWSATATCCATAAPSTTSRST